MYHTFFSCCTETTLATHILSGRHASVLTPFYKFWANFLSAKKLSIVRSARQISIRLPSARVGRIILFLSNRLHKHGSILICWHRKTFEF